MRSKGVRFFLCGLLLAPSISLSAPAASPEAPLTRETKLTAEDAEVNDFFGNAVAVSGKTAVVGAYLKSSTVYFSGAAYVFVRDRGVWSEQQKLTASDPTAGEYFGCSVAVSDDTAVIGAFGDSGAGGVSGAAYVFGRRGGVWSQQQKLTASDAAAYDQFGTSVAVDGNTALIGSPFASATGWRSGAVYVYKRIRGEWRQIQKLAPPNSLGSDRFGGSVAISGDTAIVGAIGDSTNGTQSGAAYLYVRIGDHWALQQKLTPNDSTLNDFFGFSVGIRRNTALVGSRHDSGAGFLSGSAYVFARSGGAWSLQQRLAASDAVAFDSFGLSVAVSTDFAVIGSLNDSGAGYLSGSAYVFSRNANVWSERQKLTASDAAQGDEFCIVAADGDTVVVGAPYRSDAGLHTGAAYVYER